MKSGFALVSIASDVPPPSPFRVATLMGVGRFASFSLKPAIVQSGPAQLHEK